MKNKCLIIKHLEIQIKATEPGYIILARMSLVAVPGFGFLPQESANILHTQLNVSKVSYHLAQLQLKLQLSWKLR